MVINKRKLKMFKMKNILSILILLSLVIMGCEKELDYQFKIDNRLKGKDQLFLSHVNPKTGVDYTTEELAALEYDPKEEDFFTGPINLKLAAEAKLLKIEVINNNEVIETISGFTETNGLYEATFSSTVSDLGLGIGESFPITFKFTYDNLGDDGFNYNAVLSLDFLIRDDSPNLALNKPSRASSEAYGTFASTANDGNTNSNYPNIVHTADPIGVDSWWEVDLEDVHYIRQVNIYNRTDCCSELLTNYHVFISEVPFTDNSVAAIQAQPGVTDIFQTSIAGHPTKLTDINVMGRFVRKQFDSTDAQFLEIGEVEVY